MIPLSMLALLLNREEHYLAEVLTDNGVIIDDQGRIPAQAAFILVSSVLESEEHGW